ncbi:ATP-binding protein [Photobacterium atrarenae]|uniref:histidine kinase n=1 Tax=Photobacterium atrarenae TaxID=865757 RepID=A0ABY5GIQ5_9GAMM|nr:ATP-binding protein [Photobacterium atrarenae]UTV29167.1 ATP-binding protein [Photobacterium atrarenae]
MLKAFSVLWLAVFMPTLFLILPTGLSPISLINAYVEENYYEETYRGTFYLLKQHLQSVPQAQWPDAISALSDTFGYSLQLQPVEDVTLDSDQKDKLLAGAYVLSTTDHSALLHRVEESPWVISLGLNQSLEEHVRRNSRGTFHLLAQAMQTIPVSDWTQYLQSVNQQVPYTLLLQTDDELKLSATETTLLNNAQPVVRQQPDGQMTLYYRLNAPYVLQADQVDGQYPFGHYYGLLLITFVIFISAAMFLWVYPLWRDLNRLAVTANDFGEGRLEKRAKVSRSSTVEKLGRSFNQMADSIEEMILGQREMTNAIAHDLRTPLYRLRFAFEMLGSEETTTAQKDKYENVIRASIDDLDHLINQTLVLSRYSRITDVSQFRECELARLIEKELDHFRDEHAGLVIEYRCCDDLREMTAVVDSRAMVRALNNLLSNAGRFARTTIRVTLSSREDQFSLIVEDDGCGLPESAWGKIFEPFAQENNAPRERNSGHGLGLAIVQQIANWHKGHVSIQHSTLGGARFDISWPKQSRQSVPETA